MRKTTFALTCAIAAMVASGAMAQDARPGIGNGQSCKKAPPGSGEQLCIDDGTEASRGRLAPRTTGSVGDAALAPAPPVYSPRVYTEPAPQAAIPSSAAASTLSSDTTSVTTEVIASAPVPDTPANRARYGQPLSNGGRRTAASGN
jgi:hypothetical protein